MTTDAGTLLDAYLGALERELHDLAPADRAEILLEVRDHFDEARRELVDPAEADLRNILERLGSPREIAAEARRRLGTQPTQPVATPVTWGAGILEVAAVVAWVFWWPLGAVLAAVSPRWTRRDKAIAVMIELVFIGLVVGYFTTPAYVLRPTLVLILMTMPPSVHGIFSAAYLGWKLASPAPRTWGTASLIAFRAGLVVVVSALVYLLAIGPALLWITHGR